MIKDINSYIVLKEISHCWFENDDIHFPNELTKRGINPCSWVPRQ